MSETLEDAVYGKYLFATASFVELGLYLSKGANSKFNNTPAAGLTTGPVTPRFDNLWRRMASISWIEGITIMSEVPFQNAWTSLSACGRKNILGCMIVDPLGWCSYGSCEASIPHRARHAVCPVQMVLSALAVLHIVNTL
jgi:hypothetical protein